MGPKKKTLAPPPGQASIHTFFGKSPDLTKKAPPAAHAPESNGEDKAKGGQTPLIKAKSPTKPKSKTETKDENTSEPHSWICPVFYTTTDPRSDRTGEAEFRHRHPVDAIKVKSRRK